MAMNGHKNPDLNAIRIGAHRAEVELQLGTPVSSQKIDDTVLDVYYYEIGNEPSAARAMGHAAMDFVTLGLWEIAGTPIESYQGEKKTIAVTYDKNNIVINIGHAEIKKEKEKSAEKNKEQIQPVKTI
jgi:outer membrane protein assembly factor BamE (lipoprotein component of BamABCDE complex)